MSQSPDIFKSASKFFVEKYLSDDDERVRTFIEDFSEEWIDQNNTWYESYNHPNDAGSCSTNNGNESIELLSRRYSKNYDFVPLPLPSRYRPITVPLPFFASVTHSPPS